MEVSVMTQLKEIVEKENINLDEYVTFVTDNQKVLAANVKYVKIKQRQDHLMGITFTINPKQLKEVNEFFDSLTSGERIYYNISQTGYISVNYRGMLPISKNVTHNPEETFSITVMVDPAVTIPKDTYEEPVCDSCVFHYIK